MSVFLRLAPFTQYELCNTCGEWADVEIWHTMENGHTIRMRRCEKCGVITSKTAMTPDHPISNPTG